MKAEIHPPTTNTTNPMRASSGLHTKYMCAAIQEIGLENHCGITAIENKGFQRISRHARRRIHPPTSSIIILPNCNCNQNPIPTPNQTIPSHRNLLNNQDQSRTVTGIASNNQYDPALGLSM
ncbi:hypothetical protein K438DRAFT_1885247 [Mycena galopus ATCC 62051]|nr:hypothetical protein K438DRAFT_1885247 [Mycena galopus ATCC 62051]